MKKKYLMSTLCLLLSALTLGCDGPHTGPNYLAYQKTPYHMTVAGKMEEFSFRAKLTWDAAGGITLQFLAPDTLEGVSFEAGADGSRRLSVGGLRMDASRWLSGGFARADALSGGAGQGSVVGVESCTLEGGRPALKVTVAVPAAVGGVDGTVVIFLDPESRVPLRLTWEGGYADVEEFVPDA